MTQPYVRDAVPQDVDDILSAGLREADLMELEAGGLDEGEALRESFANTPKCKAVIYNDRPIALFGVAPVRSKGVRIGVIWFLGTDCIQQISTRFLRESREWLKNLSADYDLLTNVVHQANIIHVRWLRWLGFTFLSRRYGPFIEFVRISECAPAVTT